ncbi:hypothetical protein FOZ62_005159, partial [Perkinsus olseni]
MEGQTNTIFVRNLAVQANEQNLRDLFSRLDRVLNVQIMTFPGTSLRYARVDFGTSNGVTAAHSLNGQPFHGVPLTVSVTDPVAANAPATTPAPLPNLGVPAAQQLVGAVTSIRPQPGVGVTTIGGGVRDSGEEMILNRTVYVSGLANQVTLEEVRGMFGHFGEIKESSIDVSPYDQCQFALVEFQNEAAAQEAIRVGEIPYRGRVVRVEKSKETVKLYPPTDVVFGKPMTIGRHVTPLLPGNPGSQISGAMRTRRDEIIDEVGEAAMQIEDWLESRGRQKRPGVSGRSLDGSIMAITTIRSQGGTRDTAADGRGRPIGADQETIDLGIEESQEVAMNDRNHGATGTLGHQDTRSQLAMMKPSIGGKCAAKGVEEEEEPEVTVEATEQKYDYRYHHKQQQQQQQQYRSNGLLRWRRKCSSFWAGGGWAYGTSVGIPVRAAGFSYRDCCPQCPVLLIASGGGKETVQPVADLAGRISAVSHAQYGQDIFVAEYFSCDTRTPRRYLDIGAFDGTNLSSTYVLESHFNFTTGICVDAHPNNFDGRRCEVVKAVVGSADDDEVTFRRVSAGLLDSQENSGSVSWVVGEHSQMERTREGLYVDEKSITRSIRSILQDADWPVGPIDFVSLDVEGSELAVLQGFPFDRYCVRLWLIEEQSPIPAANVSEFMMSLGYSAGQLVGLDRVYTPNLECCFGLPCYIVTYQFDDGVLVDPLTIEVSCSEVSSTPGVPLARLQCLNGVWVPIDSHSCRSADGMVWALELPTAQAAVAELRLFEDARCTTEWSIEEVVEPQEASEENLYDGRPDTFYSFPRERRDLRTIYLHLRVPIRKVECVAIRQVGGLASQSFTLSKWTGSRWQRVAIVRVEEDTNENVSGWITWSILDTSSPVITCIENPVEEKYWVQFGPGDVVAGSERTVTCAQGFASSSSAVTQSLTVACLSSGRWSPWPVPTEDLLCEPSDPYLVGGPVGDGPVRPTDDDGGNGPLAVLAGVIVAMLGASLFCYAARRVVSKKRMEWLDRRDRQMAAIGVKALEGSASRGQTKAELSGAASRCVPDLPPLPATVKVEVGLDSGPLMSASGAATDDETVQRGLSSYRDGHGRMRELTSLSAVLGDRPLESDVVLDLTDAPPPPLPRALPRTTSDLALRRLDAVTIGKRGRSGRKRSARRSQSQTSSRPSVLLNSPFMGVSANLEQQCYWSLALYMSFCFSRAAAMLLLTFPLLSTITALAAADSELFAVPSRMRFSKPL